MGCASPGIARRSTSSRMRIWDERGAGLFKNCYCQFAGDGWKIVKKNLQSVTGFQVVEQRLDGYSSTSEDGSSTVDFRVNCDQWHFHGKTPIARGWHSVPHLVGFSHATWRARRRPHALTYLRNVVTEGECLARTVRVHHLHCCDYRLDEEDFDGLAGYILRRQLRKHGMAYSVGSGDVPYRHFIRIRCVRPNYM